MLPITRQEIDIDNIFAEHVSAVYRTNVGQNKCYEIQTCGNTCSGHVAHCTIWSHSRKQMFSTVISFMQMVRLRFLVYTFAEECLSAAEIPRALHIHHQLAWHMPPMSMAYSCPCRGGSRPKGQWSIDEWLLFICMCLWPELVIHQALANFSASWNEELIPPEHFLCNVAAGGLSLFAREHAKEFVL